MPQVDWSGSTDPAKKLGDTLGGAIGNVGDGFEHIGGEVGKAGCRIGVCLNATTAPLDVAKEFCSAASEELKKGVEQTNFKQKLWDRKGQRTEYILYSSCGNMNL